MSETDDIKERLTVGGTPHSMSGSDDLERRVTAVRTAADEYLAMRDRPFPEAESVRKALYVACRDLLLYLIGKVCSVRLVFYPPEKGKDK